MPVPFLETFKAIPDSNLGVAAVPTAGNTKQVTGQSPLLNVDLVAALDFYFQMKYTTNAYGGTANLSPFFPYNHIGQLQVPYQSGNLKVFDGDGHAAWLMNWLRPAQGIVDKYSVDSLLGDQKPVLTSGYSAMSTTGVSSGSYTVAPSTAEVYKFNLRVPFGLWFDTYYDYQADGKIVPYNEVFVSPLIMSSTGRAITPVIKLNPLNGNTVDLAPFAQTGGGTAFAASTDQGSAFDTRRTGWRSPGQGQPLPRFFNWAYTVQVARYNLNNATPSIVLPPSGQLLSCMVRMFDPTLTSIASTVGNVIPVSNLSEAILQYGSGIAKYDDDAPTHVRRIEQQKGSIPTEGVLVWDMFGPSRSNCPGEVINTLNTAGVNVKLNFGANTPGAGSYADVITEQLVLVR